MPTPQPVKVINIPAPLPVRVVNLQALPVSVTNFPSGGPDALSITVAALTFVTVIVALITLARVNRQIVLAREALSQSIEALKVTCESNDLTRASNKLVEQDLEYSRTQATYVTRQAKLTLWHTKERGPLLCDVWRGPETEFETKIELWLFNDGDRTARDATLLLWFPKGWRVPGWDGVRGGADEFAAQGMMVVANVSIGNERFERVTADVPAPTYPGVERLALSFKAILPVGFDGHLLWRVVWDDGVSPPLSEPEGRLHFQTVREAPLFAPRL